MILPEPRPLEYAEIPTAVDNTIDAFEYDPVQRYIFDTPDGHNNLPAIRASQKVDLTAQYGALVHRDTIWTIENVASVVGYLIPERKKDPVDRVLEWIFPWGGFYKKAIYSKEQSKRQQETGDKVKKVTNDVLGQRVNSMLLVGIVSTAPAKQGHGYASAVVSAVTALADKEGRSSWLISSNTANEGFYNSLGFKTEKEILLGDDNAMWAGPPVVVALMIREYSGSRLS